MKYIKIIIISLFIILTSVYFIYTANNQKNIALNKQIIGTMQNPKPLNDGVINKNNYIEIKDFKKLEQYFVIVLGQAKYVQSIKLYWVKGFEPSSFKIETSKNLFVWKKIGVYNLKKFTSMKGLLVTEHNIKGAAAFFIKVTILKPENKTVRISEVKLYSKEKVNLVISGAKAVNIKKYSSEIIFETSVPASGYLRFGNGPTGLNQNIGMEMDIFTEHKIKIGNLLKGTKYYYQPVVRDLNGNLIVGKVKSFKTKGIPLPKFISVNINDIKKFTSKLKWSCNVPCMSELYLGMSQGKLKRYFKTSKFQSQYIVKIKKILPDTKFYFKIISKDKFNNKVVYKGDFTTKPYNIALKKKVYGSFIYPHKSRGGNFNFSYLQKITDGNYELKGIAASGNLGNKDQIAIVDLKQKYKIKNLKVVWRSIAYSLNFKVEIGNNMKKWTLIKKNINSKKSGKRRLSKGTYGLFLQSVNIEVKAKEARYVKITVPKGSKVVSDLPFDPLPFLQLAEIEIFKVPDYGSPKYIIKQIK